jgi:hypothetical protein
MGHVWSQAPLNAPDYDIFDLLGVATASGSPPVNGTANPTVTNVAGLAWEGLQVSSEPFYVVCPDNYHLSLENWNIQNTDPTNWKQVYIQEFFYNAAATTPPYGIAGPVIYADYLPVNGVLNSDGTKSRLVCPPGYFLAMFATGTYAGSATVQFAGRARFTPG